MGIRRLPSSHPRRPASSRHRGVLCLPLPRRGLRSLGLRGGSRPGPRRPFRLRLLVRSRWRPPPRSRCRRPAWRVSWSFRSLRPSRPLRRLPGPLEELRPPFLLLRRRPRVLPRRPRRLPFLGSILRRRFLRRRPLRRRRRILLLRRRRFRRPSTCRRRPVRPRSRPRFRPLRPVL